MGACTSRQIHASIHVSMLVHTKIMPEFDPALVNHWVSQSVFLDHLRIRAGWGDHTIHKLLAGPTSRPELLLTEQFSRSWRLFNWERQTQQSFCWTSGILGKPCGWLKDALGQQGIFTGNISARSMLLADCVTQPLAQKLHWPDKMMLQVNKPNDCKVVASEILGQLNGWLSILLDQQHIDAEGEFILQASNGQVIHLANHIENFTRPRDLVR